MILTRDRSCENYWFHEMERSIGMVRLLCRNNKVTVNMQRIKYIVIIGVFVVCNTTCPAQQEYMQVKNRFCENAEINSERMNTGDDLSFLLSPLTELELDSDYMVSDFRHTWTFNGWIKDVSSLRLYVRDKKQQRPDNSYFEKEYARYLNCKKNNVTYQVEDNAVPYIWPFDKIRLSGSQMSIWQAYLLNSSSTMFGMRNEANYNQEYLITSPEDVDSILSLICTSWESFSLQNKEDTTKINGYKAKHLNETLVLIDSLQNIKSKGLTPSITFHGDSATIEHYSFLEFRGLARSKTTLLLSHNRRRVKEVEKRILEIIAPYQHLVYY